MSLTAAERQKKHRAAKQETESARDLFVEHLMEEIKWLREANARLEKEAVSLRHELVTACHNVTKRDVTELPELASTASGLGGLGGSRSGSPSPLTDSENTEKKPSYKDLNGKTHARDESGFLSNGTRVPGRLGDDDRDMKACHENRHTLSRRDVTAAASDDDFDRAETELRRRPLKDADMVAKAASETLRLEAEMGGGK
jgi:hypothetical protein